MVYPTEYKLRVTSKPESPHTKYGQWYTRQCVCYVALAEYITLTCVPSEYGPLRKIQR